MFFNKFAICSLPYFKFFFNKGWPSFGLKQFLMVDSFCVPSSFFDTSEKEEEKRKLALTDFLNQLSHL